MSPSALQPLKRIFAVKEVGILLILLGMILAMSLWTDSFATESNTISILQAIAPIAIMGIGQTIVILTAGIDLSVGSVCALSAYTMSLLLIGESQPPLWISLLVAVGTGAACGLFSGLVIAKLKVTPFIVTLGMLSACSGLTLGLSGGKQIGLNKFGVEQEVVASILSPDAVIEGQPEVERHYYSDSGETTALLPIGSDRVWMGGAQPGSVALVGSDWEPLTEIQMDEEAILALAEGPEDSVYAGGAPGGKIWLCSPDGTKKLFYETGAERVASLLSFSDGTLAVGTGSPGRLIHLDAEGNVIEEWKIGEPESVLSLTLGEEGELLAGTARPAQLISIASDKQPEVLLESEDEQIEQVQVDEDGTIWFVSGGAKPSKLQKLVDGQVELIWDSPKKPIRGFLIYPEGVVVVSTGNVGSMYLIRGGGEPERLHSMTAHKARVLAKGPSGKQVLIGNAGPAGVGTMTTAATDTGYPQAEVFNNLYVYAPAFMVLLMILGWLFLRFTRWGTYVYAIGGNETAARLSGIQVDRIKIIAYTLSGMLAGVAAIFLTSKLHTLDPNLAKGYELKVIAAVVIGGTSLMGGEGSVWGTLIGAALLFVLNYALVHLGMEDIWSDLFIGAIIILAAVLDSTRSRFPQIWSGLKQRFGMG
ncbi:MAG: hypothetical protein H6751_01840 [Candidatus Omnitrophica bacterium]|nr:hypothetical protein [Candidatus Omnitrophota bacterium]